MIKNAIIYRVTSLPARLDQVEQALAKVPFVECGATQEKSIGWVPPRGAEHGAMVDDEVREHIAAGKLPTKLAMTWDDRVSFLLTDCLQVRKIAFLDCVFDGTKTDEGGFDTDVAIATGELAKLIPDLIEALGGAGSRA
ncbi:recombination-associated protein RdgC [Acidovorax sp. SUPP3334]|uniref:recombination-associated protein RdgC n=1 Tax=Acidovorax sp. SUPP3334 TaxID=2920881 RepID=UPI0023DE1BFF|nr:recombination-associated protein RdgC [Acidovorax sp. SUPP3334]GKT22539.1 hypothetical protein AVHM3334_08765 [Acidovorax sp. SUPP3334]